MSGLYIYTAPFWGTQRKKASRSQGPLRVQQKRDPQVPFLAEDGLGRLVTYSTAAMPAATLSMLPLFSAATQMRPLDTA